MDEFYNLDDGDGNSRPAADIVAHQPYTSFWRVARTLWIAFGLLVFILIFGSSVSYFAIRQIDQGLFRIVEVEQPLEEAVLEMEINAGEAARGVLNYVRDLDRSHIRMVEDSEADFKHFAAQFERLAETDEVRNLGRKVTALFAEFKMLGDEIVNLAVDRNRALDIFRRDAFEIDEVIDEKIQKAIDRTAPNAIDKLEAALDMEINIDEAFAAIEGYILQSSPDLRGAVEDAEADFKHFEAMYRSTDLSAEEKGWIDDINRDFVEAVNAGNQIMKFTDDLNARLDDFEHHLEQMDTILDDQIQPLIHAETAAAAVDAQTSTDQAYALLLILSLLGIIIAVLAAWFVVQAIAKPIQILAKGAEIVGSGNLDHRIDIKSRDAFGHLAATFNNMIVNLSQALLLIEDSREHLKRRVEQRTAELTAELIAREYAETELLVATEAAELANRSKSDFLANMSHELRTPLNAILGFSEMIRCETFGPVGSPKYIEYVTDIHGSGRHLLALINDILDLSKIEANQVELHVEKVDVFLAIGSCMTLVKGRAETGGVNLQSEFSHNLPPFYADQRMLKQILINLLSNAIKFTKAGGDVTIKSWPGPDGGYVFQVSDTGIGIAPEDIPKALAPFQQIDSDLNRKYDGTGLGLPLTKSLMDLHGGSMELHSEIGVGTTVTVVFPAENVVSAAAVAAAKSSRTFALKNIPENFDA